MEGQTFLRDGVMMVRVPDGREFRVSDVMRLNNPGMEYDDMTGEAMAMTPPRDGGGSSKPREYSFGDVGSETLARTIDDVSSTAGGGGEITRALLPEDWQQTFPDAMLAAGDYGLAGLLGLLGAAETGAGYAGDVVEGAQGLLGIDSGYRPGGSARGFQRALMGMAEGAGYAPEGRMIASLTEAGAPRAAARAAVDRLNQPGQMPTTYSNPIPGLLGDASSAAADPAIQRADEVLGLLKSGRTDEVTDAMLDMGDPVLNARLNEHLFNNYDLPMDAASRMERAGGIEAYHGTSASFPAFDNRAYAASGFGTHMGAKEAADSILRAKRSPYSPEDAPAYVEGSQVLPLRVGAGPMLRVNDTETWNPSATQFAMAWSDDPAAVAAYNRLQANSDYPKFGSDAEQAAFMQNALERDGVGGFVYDNAFEGGGDSYAVLNPANIRSAFARFDPRLSHLRNLNAALTAGVPLGLLSMSEEE